MTDPGTARQGVAILGSTGSIGCAALRVLARHPERFRPIAITAHSRTAELARQAADTGARFVGVAAPCGPVPDGWHTGAAALVAAATRDDVDVVVNAVVGAAGLDATIAALDAGKRVALANKESLVMAGELVLAARDRGGALLVPVDSEHSAILQCIGGRPMGEIRRLVLTASGGPFRDWPRDRLAAATVDDALRHPTWNMGRKISIDSATLANKALEVIEAHHLFGVPYDCIDVVVHPQSVVHSFVEFVDGSIVAQLGVPSMELPILVSLTWPARVRDDAVPRFEPARSPALTFEPVDGERFPALALGIAAGRRGGSAPAVYNGANEAAVTRFLAGRIGFARIAELVRSALGALERLPADTLDDIKRADRAARRHVEELT